MEYSLDTVGVSRTGHVQPAESSRAINAPAELSGANEAHASGVSWAAVMGGALVISALSLILLALGSGLGLSSVSPWSGAGVSASAIGTAAILWLIATQLIASMMGGYLAGRLRTKWASIHNDEVFFRDTAHGFLSWSLAAVLTAAFLTSAAATMIGNVAQVATSTSSLQGNGDGLMTSNLYYTDKLFRSEPDKAVVVDPAVNAEGARIFANGLTRNELSDADRIYLGKLIAARTGLSQTESEKRVADVMAESRQTLDTVRKAAAHLSLWIFVALLTGAFCASYAATIGGRQRDHVVNI